MRFIFRFSAKNIKNRIGEITKPYQNLRNMLLPFMMFVI